MTQRLSTRHRPDIHQKLTTPRRRKLSAVAISLTSLPKGHFRINNSVDLCNLRISRNTGCCIALSRGREFSTGALTVMA
jgi:hypothetical protein